MPAGAAAAGRQALYDRLFGNWLPEARVAIREVALWLDQQGQHGCSLLLRQEVDR
jgi:hypothetical protein